MKTAFHGTSLSLGNKIFKDGFLKPRDGEGNWSGGLSGGNPSCEGLVYVANDPLTAEVYANTVSKKRKEHTGAIVTVDISKAKLIPDEDVVFELLKADHPMAYKIRKALAHVLEFDEVDSAMEYFSDQEVSDSELAMQMCDLAQYISDSFSKKDLMALTVKMDTMAVDGAVPVLEITEIALGR